MRYSTPSYLVSSLNLNPSSFRLGSSISSSLRIPPSPSFDRPPFFRIENNFDELISRDLEKNILESCFFSILYEVFCVNLITYKFSFYRSINRISHFDNFDKLTRCVQVTRYLVLMFFRLDEELKTLEAIIGKSKKKFKKI